MVNAQRYTWVTLTINTNLSGAGWVSPGTGNYYYGQQIVLNAYTRTGYSFDGWFIDGVYQGKLSSMPLTVTKDSVIDAVFSKRVVGLTISVNPPEAATLAPNSGVYTYTYGDSVNVKQYPNAGYNFSGYYLDGVYIGLGTGITVYMDKDHQLTAYFQGGSGSTTIPTLPTQNPTVTPTPEPTATPNPSLPMPDLVFFCTSSSEYTGFNVKLSGRLSYNDTGISGAGIVFSYSITGGLTWQDLAYVITDDIGGFSAVWMPFATGTYMIKAAWAGDDVYSRVSKTVNYVIEPSSEDINDADIFSVTSNSTVTSIAFDSTEAELSFSVSGSSGTEGYVQVSIPKTMITDIDLLSVKLDEIQIQYTAETRGNVWLISFAYHHSSHEITMVLNGPEEKPSVSDSNNTADSNVISNPWMIIAIVAIVIAIVAIAMLFKINRKK